MAKILVADDNSNIQKMVGLALKDQGIDVVAVGNGEAAVRKIADLKPDLVLADVFMPVRNGYEVCKFVKEDPALSHIPVILLVGAFDPLDEQEAQRVGADGVLKKPFVPPDPLISMVKSALLRAGVTIGNAPAQEKVPEVPKRNAADLLSPAASKLAALSSASLPEAVAEEVPEEFPSMPSQVKIAAGHEPVAFGSLLETEEEEEADDVAEEEAGNGWRPGGDLTAREPEEAEIESKVKDWREEAFHGSSPTRAHRSQRWAPAVADAELATSTGSRASAVTTLEPKPAPAEAPAFSGDAWAAAMAAGVEEKLAAAPEAMVSPPASQQVPEVAPAVESKEGTTEQGHVQTVEAAPLPVTLPENNWYSVTASPWEVEAKKASQLASTWDTFVAEPPAVESESPAQEPGPASTYVAESPVETAEPVQEFVHGSPSVESSSQMHEVLFESTPEAEAPSAYAADSLVNETQEIEAYQAPAPPTSENTWETAPAEVVSQFVETSAQEFVSTPTEYVVEQGHQPVVASEPTPEVAPAAAEAPSMDDLVARVLSRMSPEVLQKVTQDILKPVIAALIQDELSTRK